MCYRFLQALPYTPASWVVPLGHDTSSPYNHHTSPPCSLTAQAVRGFSRSAGEAGCQSWLGSIQNLLKALIPLLYPPYWNTVMLWRIKWERLRLTEWQSTTRCAIPRHASLSLQQHLACLLTDAVTQTWRRNKDSNRKIPEVVHRNNTGC